MNSQTVIGIYLRFRNGRLAKIIYPFERELKKQGRMKYETY